MRYIFFFILTLNANALSLSTLASSSDLNLKLRPIKNKKLQLNSAKPIVSSSKLKNILNDYKNRITNNFDVPPFFYPNVYFWLNVYSNYNSNQIMIHNKHSLDLIYKAIDFSNLTDFKLDEIERQVLQSQLSQMQVNKLKISILNNSSTFKGLYKDVNIKMPKNGYKKELRLRRLARNLRIQTGQRNFFKKGLIRSIPYQKNILNIIKEYGIPKSLIAIPFLESSFNVNAKSKVGASGIWQIMPFIRRRIFKKERGIDYTDNIYISSLGALKLFRENFNILKRWDLAITAYNSGVKHILHASQKLKIKRKNLSLTTLFKKYNNENHGFASVNFYAGFLALTRVLNYQDQLFPDVSFKEINKPSLVGFYVNKCTENTKRFFNAFKNKKKIKDLNLHLKTKRFSRGNIVVSEVNLSKNRYEQISINKFKYKYPKVFSKKRYKCSTR